MNFILLIFCAAFLIGKSTSTEEIIVLNDVTNKVLILLSKDFVEINRTKSRVKPGSYKLDADRNTLLLGDKQTKGILYYLSNKTGQSDWTILSYFVNGTLADLALDSKYDMAYVATDVGLVYSVNLLTQDTLQITMASNQPVRALKIDRNERILYLLQENYSNLSINKYFIDNGLYAAGPILDKAIDNFAVDFTTKTLFGSINNIIYHGSLNLGALSQFYVGKQNIKEFVLGSGYLAVSVPGLNVVIKVDSTTGEELKKVDVNAENVVVIFPAYDQQTTAASATTPTTTTVTTPIITTKVSTTVQMSTPNTYALPITKSSTKTSATTATQAFSKTANNIPLENLAKISEVSFNTILFLLTFHILFW